jgi:hypothetical protein
MAKQPPPIWATVSLSAVMGWLDFGFGRTLTLQATLAKHTPEPQFPQRTPGWDISPRQMLGSYKPTCRGEATEGGECHTSQGSGRGLR